MFKHTMIFNWRPAVQAVGFASGKSSAGWSESYLSPTIQQVNFAGAWPNLIQARRAFLPVTTTIVGYRITDMTRSAATLAYQTNWPGSATVATDLATLAMQASGNGSTGNKLRLIMRGLPDAWGQGGQLDLAPELTDAFNAYVRLLPPFCQLARNTTAVTADILSIDVSGNVITKQALAGVAIGSMVRLLRVHSQGNNANGVFQVETVTTGSQFKLRSYVSGTAKFGRVRMEEPPVQNFYVRANMQIDALTSRKAGRAFFSYRGRR